MSAHTRARLLGHFSRVQLCNPTDRSPPGSPAHGILQQEYWSGCCAHLQGIFPIQGLNRHLSRLLLRQAGSFTTVATWEAPPLHT